MKIKFIAYEAKDQGKPSALHNVARVAWIKKAGKNGRSLGEIKKHKKHYSRPQADLNYDLKKKIHQVKDRDLGIKAHSEIFLISL